MNRSRFLLPRAATSFVLTAVTLLGGLAAEVASAAVIYQENFDGSGATDLAGLTPDVSPLGATWGGATAFKADGAVVATSAGIYLPFAPSAGFVYTLSGTFQVTAGDWLGIGFAGGSPTSTSRLADNLGRGWVIAKDGQYQAFVGPNTAGSSGQATISTQSPAGTVTTQTITLDASSSNPTAWTYSATQTIGSSTYAIWTNEPANITSANDITAIGLSTGGASGTFTGLSLVAVPEPTAMVMPAIGGGFFAIRIIRRRRRKRQPLGVEAAPVLAPRA
jgi:hypothetical protein